jgi:uncharacterized RDD family membrane protein YckC
MEFIIKDYTGTEHGPVDVDTLKKWIDEDRVTKDTPVRQKLIALWKTAADFEALRENLATQAERLDAKDGVAKSISALSSVKSIFHHKPHKEKTSFVHKHIAENAESGSRIWAFVFDLVLLSIVLFLPIFAICNNSALKIAAAATDSSLTELPLSDNLYPDAGKVTIKEAPPETAANTQSLPPGAAPGKDNVKPAADAVKTETKPEVKKRAAPPTINNLKATTPPSTVADETAGYRRGSVWQNQHSAIKYVCLDAAEKAAKWIEVKRLKRVYTFGAMVAIPIFMVYFGVTLGYFAQTFGMWFWGIFIIRRDLMEVYFFRAFVFTVLMMVFGILSPLLVYICGRSLHDLLAGVRIINVAGKTPD